MPNDQLDSSKTLAKALRHIAHDDRMRKLYGDGLRSKASMLLDSADLLEQQQLEMESLRSATLDQSKKLAEASQRIASLTRELEARRSSNDNSVLQPGLAPAT